MMSFNTRRAYFLLSFLFTVSFLKAQDYRIDAFRTITACEGNFFDSGGATGPYAANQNFTTTICSDGSVGSHIKLLFTQVDIFRNDQLCIFDGVNTSAPLLACAEDFSIDAVSDVISVTPTEPVSIQASAENLTGCVTVSFNSDATGQRDGWLAEISCIPACQKIEARLTTSDPMVQPLDTGWIDACPGQRIFLSAQGNFPQEGLFYNHRDSAQYIWDFGDGTVKYGQNVDHTFNTPGGYIVQLTIEDQLGCTNFNFINQRVRISDKPNFDINTAIDLNRSFCSGDTISLKAAVNGTDPNSVIAVIPKETSFLAQRIRSDSLPLPDGTGVPYETSVKFSNFRVGQTLTDVQDLNSICVNMEHSYMRDLEIKLTCPNGQSVVLHEYPGRSGARSISLGIPNDNDGNLVLPGAGFDYCWTPDATKGTWISFSATGNLGMPPTLPAGDYNAFDPLSNLEGCPLNGEWTISVEDLWAFDNGFIFSWGIQFNPALYPDLETFTPAIDSYSWTNTPDLIYFSPDSIVSTVINAGENAYIFSVQDEFGCAYDTAIIVNTLPLTHPDCYNCEEQKPLTNLRDTTLCAGESINLVAGQPFSSIRVGFTAFPMYDSIGNFTHPSSTPYESTITVNSVFPGIIVDPVEDIVSVCIDLETAETDWVNDIELFLRAPNGTLLELSSGNGGAGSNYTNTCFTPTAVTSIRDGLPPFTGNYRPEGSWSNLTGVETNGDWTLLVADTDGPLFGTLNTWSITFNSRNGITYTWSPNDGLSCANCPNPIAQPTATTTYNLQISDVFNCAYQDTVVIANVGDYQPPIINCEITDLNARTLTFNWEEQNGIPFEVRVNGGDWISPNINNITHAISGLEINQSVTLELRPNIPNIPANCTIETTTQTCTYDACSLNITPTAAPSMVSCPGQTDGSISFTIASGTGPYNFTLDGLPNGSMTSDTTGTFGNLAAGTHQIIVTDANACADTLNFTTQSPPNIQIAADIQDVSCFGGTDGTIIVSAVGGTGNLSLRWNNNATTTQITDLAANTYLLNILDLNGCSFDTSFIVTEPPLLNITLDATNLTCADDVNGTITANAVGGTGNLTYRWSNEATTSQITNLGVGNFTLTVTDENNCQMTASNTIESPDPLIITAITALPADCNGNNTGAAIVQASGGTAPYQYLWNDNLGQTSDTARFLIARTYAITVTDDNGCTVSQSVAVEEPAALSIDLQLNPVNCFGGADGTATALVDGGTAPYSYRWSDPESQTTQTALRLGGGDFNVTITDAQNCTAQQTFTILQPTAPLTARISQTFTSCFGLRESQAQVAVSGGTGPNYTYTWSNGQTTALATNLDTIIYTVTVTDERGCKETFSSSKIKEHPEYNININFNIPSCFGETNGAAGATVRTGGTGTGYRYLWNTDPVQITPLIENIVGGRSYTVTVTDDQGCVGVRSSPLPQPDPIMVSLSSTDVTCNGGNDGTTSITSISGGNQGYRFVWDAKTGNSTEANVNNLQAGTYQITVTDTLGCFTTAQVEVIQPTAVTVEFTVKDNTCNGGANGAINAKVTGGIPSYSLRWSTSDVTSKVDGLSAGTYTLTVTDANQCEFIQAADVGQPDLIQINVETGDITCAGGRDGELTILASGGTSPFTYSLDGKSFTTNPRFIGRKAGEYTLYVKDSNGCQKSMTTELVDPPAFSVFIFPTTDVLEINFGESVQLFANANNQMGKVAYSWSASFADSTLSCLDCFNPMVTPTTTTYYELLGTDESGCEARDDIQIRVRKTRTVLVPTGFTPNGDAVNNNLIVHGSSSTTVKLFRVYDRYGELVFENEQLLINDPMSGWDGTFRGKEMPAGVYVWYAEVEYEDGMKEALKGSTLLIR